MPPLALRPKPEEFIEFRLCGCGAFDHPVYKWLRSESSFQRAEKKFRRSQHYQSLAPGNLLKLDPGDEQVVAPGMQEDALLDFAQHVAYCLGHFLSEGASKVWAGSARDRQRAARDYEAALRWLKKGYGPYDEESKTQLGQLLNTGREYLLGKHLSPGFRIKGGSARPVGMLARELVVHLDFFEMPRALLTDTIVDLIDLVGAIVDRKTIERHVKAAERHVKTIKAALQ